MLRILLLLVGLGCWHTQTEAQSIRRQTLCGVGAVQTNGDNLRVSSSFGQKSIACDVIFNGNNYLRQGFQQPITIGEQPCDFTVSFEFEAIETDCGTYYNFEYSGSADLDEATFEWEFGDAAAPATSSDPNPTDVTYQTTGQKTVSLRVFQDDCEAGAALIINVDDTGFGALTDITDNACFGDEDGSIELMVFGNTGTASINWADGSTQATRTGLAAGDYSYTVTDDAGCEFFETVTVGGSTTPLEVAGTVVAEQCDGTQDGSITLSVAGAADGDLEFLLNGSPATASSNVISGLSAGTYTVVVIDANGCRAEAGFMVVNLCEDPQIPDVITPNKDGTNDVFVIPGIENFPNNEVFVFNRWGQAVYDVTGYDNTWEGTNLKGESLPFGAYYYVVRLNDSDETIYGGSLTIVR